MIVRRVVKFSFLSLALCAGGMLTLFSASIYTFNVLSDETRIAEIRFDQLGPAHYRATLTTGDDCDWYELETYGDQWRIDAEFVKWKYWALLLGLDSQYRLDRFEGRYRSVTDQNQAATLSHDLSPDTTVDLVSAANALGRFNFLLDATYGSSTYQDIDTSRVYTVYRTQTGIITRNEARAEPDPAASAVIVDINRACGAEPGIWESFARWADGTARRVL